MDESLMIEIWDTFKDYISEKNREGAAIQFIAFLDSKEFDVEELYGLDLNLDHAIDQIVKDCDSDDDDDVDDDYDYDYDDED